MMTASGTDSNAMIMLEMAPQVRLRLEAAAMLKGISTQRYCMTAIDNELARDEANGASDADARFDRQAFERAVTRRTELFKGVPLTGDSVELIREARAREYRDAQIENWA